MESRRTKIEIPKGYEIDKEQSTFEEIVFKPILKVLPKTWEELETVEGYYVSSNSYINSLGISKADDDAKNTFATKEQAEACVALAQICQLMKVYNDGWVPNWSSYEDKHVITFNDDKIKLDCFMFHQSFLAFKTQKIRDTFYENFRDLINIAKPLL